MIVCRNGALVDAAQAAAPTDGLYEIIAVKDGRPKRIGAHLARLRQGAAALGVTLAQGDLQLRGLMADTLIANAMADALLHVSVNADTLFIAVSPLPLQPTPAKVIVAQTRRPVDRPPVKRINDPASAAARQEAYARQADDALLLNDRGRLVDGSAGNVFLLLHGGLVTPPLSDGALPGTVRGDLIGRFRAEEKSLTLDDLGKASEVFLSSVIGLRPVVAVDGRPVGDGETGLVTAMLATRV